MTDPRSVLGTAWCGPEQLRDVVGRLLDVPAGTLELAEVTAEVVAYDQVAITTGGRYRVRGEATVGPTRVRWSVFVKVIEPFARSPLFSMVPEELQALAGQLVPWRTEALVYASDLAGRLPVGLAMPRVLRVEQPHEEAYAIWLEDVPAVTVDWDASRYRRAAYLLGRLAASPEVRPLGGIGETDLRRGPVEYAEGRFRHVVVPAFEDDGLWAHPLLASFDDDLRDRMRRAASLGRAIADELDSYPHLTAHGDGCPNNLLVVDPASPYLTMIDFGFWSTQAVGFDLGQLQLGEAQLGRRTMADVAALDDDVVAAYVQGLRAESCAVPHEVVRRAHALQMVLFTGLSAMPFELLELEPTPQLSTLAATRAELARFTLDLLDDTGGLPTAG